MTHFIVYAAAVGLAGLSWVVLAFSDWLLRGADEKWPIKSALPYWRSTTNHARIGCSKTTSRSHRQMDDVHEKGRSHLSPNQVGGR
jgi:hypothetical protein